MLSKSALQKATAVRRALIAHYHYLLEHNATSELFFKYILYCDKMHSSTFDTCTRVHNLKIEDFETLTRYENFVYDALLLHSNELNHAESECER